MVYSLKNEKGWKSLLIKDGSILLLNKSVKDDEKFMSEYESKGLLKKKAEYALSDVKFMSHEADEGTDLVIHFHSGKEMFEFQSHDDLVAVLNQVQSATRLVREEKKFSMWESIKGPGGLLIGVLFIGAVTFIYASQLASGEQVEITGRRQLYQRIFLWLAENLGKTGTLLVFGGLAAACIYFMWKNMKNPGTNIVYNLASAN